MRFFFRPKSPRRQRRAARTLNFQSLEAREVFSVGLAYVGLSHAPPSEMSYLASQFKTKLAKWRFPFCLSSSITASFDNATKLAQEMLPSSVGKLRLTVDIEWFVHSNGTNGELSGGGSAAVYGRPAQKAFWAAWESARPSADQQQIRSSFMARIQQADQW